MRRHAVAVVTAVLALAAGQPPGGRDAQEWTMAPCVEPRFDSVQIEPNVDMVVLSGSATQCPPAEAHSGFRLAGYLPYEPEGAAEGYNIRLFPAAQPGQPAVRQFGAAVVPADPGVFGACLLAGANERVLCARIEVWDDAGELRAGFTPLPAGDPLVSKSVWLGEYTGEVGPGGALGGTCGTCF